MSFTMVFEGNLRGNPANPLTTETPFGVAHTVSIGDAVENADCFRDALDAIIECTSLVRACTIAEDALKAADQRITSEIKEARGK